MFCSNCGTQINEGEKFCSGCGKDAVNDNTTGENFTPQINQKEPTYNSPNGAKPKKNGKKIGGIVMTVLGVLALLARFEGGEITNAVNGDIEVIAKLIISVVLILIGAWLIYASKSKNNS